MGGRGIILAEFRDTGAEEPADADILLTLQAALQNRHQSIHWKLLWYCADWKDEHGYYQQ